MSIAIRADDVPLSASQLENAIEAARLSLLHAENNEARLYYFHCMRDLIAKRPRETIERMEREQGLRA